MAPGAPAVCQAPGLALWSLKHEEDMQEACAVMEEFKKPKYRLCRAGELLCIYNIQITILMAKCRYIISKKMK